MKQNYVMVGLSLPYDLVKNVERYLAPGVTRGAVCGQLIREALAAREARKAA